MTENQRDEILLSLSRGLNTLMEKVDGNTKELQSQRQEIVTMKQEIATMKQEIAAIKQELVYQRQCMAKLEYTLTEKIDALFVVREVHSDKIESHDKKLESIDNILGNHHQRIFELESKAN